MSKEIFEKAPSRAIPRDEMLRVIREAAEPAVASFGLEIWGIELAGAGKPVVRIFVDPPVRTAEELAALAAEDGESTSAQGGVDIGQCAEISRLTGIALDVEGIFSGAWTLEISSPGMDRPFFRTAQLPPYIGQELDVTLWDAHPDFANRKRFHGALVSAAENSFSLHMDDINPSEGGADIEFIWDSVRKARLVPVFPDTSKPGKQPAPKKEGAAKKSAGGGKKA